jgi:hypothetical protein
VGCSVGREIGAGVGLSVGRETGGLVEVEICPDALELPAPLLTPLIVGIPIFAELGLDGMMKKLLLVGVLVGNGEGTPGAVPQ